MSGHLKAMKAGGGGISFPPSPWNGQGIRGSASYTRERETRETADSTQLILT